MVCSGRCTGVAESRLESAVKILPPPTASHGLPFYPHFDKAELLYAGTHQIRMYIVQYQQLILKTDLLNTLGQLQVLKNEALDQIVSLCDTCHLGQTLRREDSRLITKKSCINMEFLCMHNEIRKTAESFCRHLRISCQTEQSVS